MERELKHGQTVHTTKAFSSTVKSMEEVISNSLMALISLESMKIITFMAMAFTLGQINVASMVNGKITKCMAKELSPGEMVAVTRVSMCMTRNVATGFILYRMVAVTRATGKTVNNMERVFSYRPLELKKKVSGTTEKEYASRKLKKENKFLKIDYTDYYYIV